MWDGEKSRSGPEIFPAVPVLCIISIICCLLLVPGFMKTRVFALTFYVWWLILGSTLILVNTCIWRGNTRNIPIYADIVAHIWGIYCLTLYAAMLCVNKLIWTISRPAPSVKVYDSRLRMNRIDILVCVGLPLLLSPMPLRVSEGIP
ncbi:hypothetical protein FRC15_004185 [Serendipita sp. 397]|nr:hypothetical protein FRC15_004185 [Serendipita sp. 397]